MHSNRQLIRKTLSQYRATAVVAGLGDLTHGRLENLPNEYRVRLVPVTIKEVEDGKGNGNRRTVQSAAEELL